MMQHYGLTLAPGVLFIYVQRTLRVMIGRQSMKDAFPTDVAGLWQAIWASMIFTFLVSLYPGLQNGTTLLLANMMMQLVAVLTMVLLFMGALHALGLSDKVFVYIVPFLWIENVQHLVAGIIQNFVIATANPALLVMITPVIIWTIYWLWRVGKDQLQRGGWVATGFLALSFVIDLLLFSIVQMRMPIALN
jgi:hypothetical protein